MVESIVDFYKDLPAKVCATCGKEIEDQHESYSNKCENCNLK